ncbi:DUF4138 domain-containing protein [uncultured Tenacibaculum sp.]|jgi:hypothetical protein|uniref:DUF4138 domain-containing protein n=1 Tax=uncultured Tenacibaculum sp. TaxID=174713 RepID=UPI0026053FB5|nr:DUF4138 domain-containing protein [uncultured Tenacibaculum sp.]
MKKYIILIAFVFVSAFAKAQQREILDTIYANDQNNVALFFPNPIRQGITGSENFVFTYNREQEQYFGLLQAQPGNESNLLIINNNGSIFSYIVKYKEELSKLNYFIPLTSSIGNEKPMDDQLTTTKKQEPRFDKSKYYERFCSYLLQRKERIGRLKKRNSGIILTVENIVFDKEELYFVIKIENRSSLDYDLNFLNFSIETRKKGKKKSLQSLYQEPNFTYKLPEKIKENESKTLVYVLPKFSISNERSVVLELNETNGERNIKLKISNEHINNPN